MTGFVIRNSMQIHLPDVVDFAYATYDLHCSYDFAADVAVAGVGAAGVADLCFHSNKT